MFLGLRTQWGINLTYFEEKFGENNKNQLLKKAQKLISKELIFEENQHLKLTAKGKLLADTIVIDLFF